MERILNVIMICLVGSCLFGCSSKMTFGLNWNRVEKTRSSIDEIIEDPVQRGEMHALVDSYAAKAGKITDDVKAIRLQIVEQNRDYDTTRAELQGLYDQLNDKLGQLLDLARDHSMKLRAMCSAAEWEDIFEHEDDLVNFKY